jgi:hypothetical protein
VVNVNLRSKGSVYLPREETCLINSVAGIMTSRNLNVDDNGPLPLGTNCLYLFISWTTDIYFGSEDPSVFIWKDVLPGVR